MVQGKFTPNLGEWSWLGCKEKGKTSAHTINKLCVKKKREDEKKSKKMCVIVIRSKAN